MNTEAEALYKAWLDSKLGKREFWRVYVQPRMSYDAFHGLTWRYAQTMGFPPDPGKFDYDFGKPLHLEGDAVICGDVQLPTTDYWFSQLVGAIGQKHLRRPRRLIIAGDLFNLDSFSDYARVIGLPSFRNEMAAARVLVGEWLAVFDEVYLFAGNHDRRVAKRTGGEILMEELMSMVTGSPKLRTSNWGHLTITSGDHTYRILHGTNYSVNQLTVASELANKYQQHIIGHHQHHAAMGWDRFKRYLVIDNGGLFDPAKMSYAVIDDNKMPNMQKGFTLLKEGTPHLLSVEPFTNWDMWLGNSRRRRAA